MLNAQKNIFERDLAKKCGGQKLSFGLICVSKKFMDTLICHHGNSS